jgi:hypothetical protein
MISPSPSISSTSFQALSIYGISIDRLEVNFCVFPHKLSLNTKNIDCDDDILKEPYTKKCKYQTDNMNESSNKCDLNSVNTDIKGIDVNNDLNTDSSKIDACIFEIRYHPFNEISKMRLRSKEWLQDVKIRNEYILTELVQQVKMTQS